MTAMIMASSETRCKCRQCRQCRRSQTFKLEGEVYGALPHIALAPPLAAARRAPHIRGRTAPTPSTEPALAPSPASFTPTQRDRWSGGQRPPTASNLHPLSHLSRRALADPRLQDHLCDHLHPLDHLRGGLGPSYSVSLCKIVREFTLCFSWAFFFQGGSP